MADDQKPLPNDNVNDLEALNDDFSSLDELVEGSDPLDNAISLEDLEYDPDAANPLDDIPVIDDEADISGSATDPEADDDVLENAQEMGIGLDEDREHPQELNIAQAVEEAERSRRGM